MPVLTDTFKSAAFNAGQEARAADFNDAQRFLSARLTDQLFESLIGNDVNGVGTGGDPDIPLTNPTFAKPNSTWAYVLSIGAAMPQQGPANNQVLIGPGSVFQLTATPDGSDSEFIPFTFDGVTSVVTLANGDVANPRVDLIQAKLEYIATDSQSRVFSIAPVKADLAMASVTTNFNTVLRAKAGGRGGNAISVRTVVGGAAAYSESGYQCTFTYVDGVTTVGTLQALAAFTSSNILEIETTGTLANVLHAPADTVGFTFLGGGQDQVLTAQTFNMKRAVQCTLSVKSGTPAVSPQYPVPDGGYCAIAAVVVPSGYTWGFGQKLVVSDDLAHATLHDQRMPLGIRKYVVQAAQGIYSANAWVTDPATPGYKQGLKSSALCELFAFQFNQSDAVEPVPTTVVHTGGRGGVTTLNPGDTNIYRLPAIPTGQFLSQLVVYAADAAGGSTFTLMTFDEVSLVYANVAGATSIGIVGTSATLTPTTPIDTSSTVFALKVTAGASNCTVKKGVFFAGISVPGSSQNQLLIPCPVTQGRLLGVVVSGNGAAGCTGVLAAYAEIGLGTTTTLATISPLVSSGTQVAKLAARDYLESHSSSNALQNSYWGPPIWCNGLRTTAPEFSFGNPLALHQLVAQLGPGSSSQTVRSVVFYVAEGI